MIEINEQNFKEEVLDYKGLVLVDFNAVWCGPCRMLKPILEELNTKRNDIKIVSINVDENQLLARKYRVMSIPCIVLIKNGEEIKRNVGLLSMEELEEFLNV